LGFAENERLKFQLEKEMNGTNQISSLTVDLEKNYDTLQNTKSLLLAGNLFVLN